MIFYYKNLIVELNTEPIESREMGTGDFFQLPDSIVGYSLITEIYKILDELTSLTYPVSESVVRTNNFTIKYIDYRELLDARDYIDITVIVMKQNSFIDELNLA